MTLCDTFKRLALETWDKINISRQTSFQLKEETITDINMLELKRRHSGELKTTVFNKHKEGTNGADWEWWFKGLNGQYIGFRVQAKIINIESEKFEHLHYSKTKNNITTYQCDKLISNALTALAPKIPLYCFYIHTNDNSLLNSWSCGSMSQMKDLYGCSLTSAFTVKKKRNSNQKDLKDLEKELVPWHCLVCCENYGDGSFIGNIQSYALSNFDLSKDIITHSGLN